MIEIKKVMILEKILLEIDSRIKYEMDFGDAYKLHTLLEGIGSITSYAFLIQDEFYSKFNDIEKLNEYHDMVIGSQIEYDDKNAVDFIEYVLLKYKNNEIESVVKGNKFW